MSFDIGEGFDWDKIKEDLEKAIKLEKDEENKTVKLFILEQNVEENQMVGGMLKGEEEMKKGLAQFLGKQEPLECDIEIDQEEKIIQMKFENAEQFNQVYELLHEMFFGDFFKKMLEAMFGAFGRMFGKD